MPNHDNLMQDHDWHSLPNFTADELKCTCGCEIGDMDKDTVFALQALRTKLGRPLAITITSGYRCNNHPIEKAKITSGKPAGTHSMGKAVDIAITGGNDSYMLVQAAIGSFTGIGVSRKDGFIHLDTGLTKDGLSRPSLWNY